ncbi:MAG: twin-arginine translocase subunit TatC [Gammaproteobacteria bacterium]|nr:twin-arginine translocase subunit TatC [Gammaproteobacteria bacterium]
MAQYPPDHNDNVREQSFISHLVELRERLLRSLLCVLIIFLALFYFANDLYSLIAAPLLKHLSVNSTMIATGVAAPFITPVKLTFFLSLLIAMPYILYQAWAFIAPGLYENERRFALPLLISSIVLFYTGIAFAFFVVFPLLFAFLTTTAPAGVTVMTDISRYLDFVLQIFFAFGLAFEVPVVTILLVWSGFTSVESLRQNRPYIIVTAFVIGMLLTPPDVLSQILLALPIWCLFELGLFFSRKFIRQQGNTKNTIYADEK